MCDGFGGCKVGLVRLLVCVHCVCACAFLVCVLCVWSACFRPGGCEKNSRGPYEDRIIVERRSEQ